MVSGLGFEQLFLLRTLLDILKHANLLQEFFEGKSNQLLIQRLVLSLLPFRSVSAAKEELSDAKVILLG